MNDDNLSSFIDTEGLSSPPIDAVVHISISKNLLEAYLNIEPPVNGGNAPTLKILKNSLVNYKITYGIDEKKIIRLSENPIYNKDIIVAQGKKPVNGTDGTYQFHFQVEKNFKPREREDGSVDFRDLSIVENVKKGQVLCSITHPTDGTIGMSVTGVKLFPIQGKSVPSFVGKNTEINEEGTAVYSTINGQVEFNGKKINVNETLYIKENIDNSTGNVKAAGNVVVRGMVLPGFEIDATGNIEIRGTVESASLKAGGNIILHSGMTGSQINCGGNLTSRFIENCNVFVRGNIRAESVMSSKIKCGKNLEVIGTIAKIVGGSCIVGQNIIANVIGSAANVKTELELGTDPSVVARQQQLVKQLPALENQIRGLKSLIALLQQLDDANRLTPEKKEALDDALFSYQTNKHLLASGRKELAGIMQSIENNGYGKVVCQGTIYPGTRVIIGAAKMVVTDSLLSISLYKSEGLICQGPAR